MKAEDVKLTSEQVANVTGCTLDNLKELTRKRGDKPPFLRPDMEAGGQGYKDFYSWNNLMCVAIFMELRRAGIERRIILPVLWAAKHMEYKFSDLDQHYKALLGHDGIGFNPFKELEAKKYLRRGAGFRPELEEEANRIEAQMFLEVTCHINELFKCVLGVENLQDIEGVRDGVRATYTAAYIRIKNGKAEQDKSLSRTDEEIKDLNLGGVVSLRFNLNKLHRRVLSAGKKLGYF
jgi:hypothetical protein